MASMQFAVGIAFAERLLQAGDTCSSTLRSRNRLVQRHGDALAVGNLPFAITADCEYHAPQSGRPRCRPANHQLDAEGARNGVTSEQAARRSALTGQSAPMWSHSDLHSTSCLARPHPRPARHRCSRRKALQQQPRWPRLKGPPVRCRRHGRQRPLTSGEPSPSASHPEPCDGDVLIDQVLDLRKPAGRVTGHAERVRPPAQHCRAVSAQRAELPI